jgi:hypothetical protein
MSSDLPIQGLDDVQAVAAGSTNTRKARLTEEVG